MPRRSLTCYRSLASAVVVIASFALIALSGCGDDGSGATATTPPTGSAAVGATSGGSKAGDRVKAMQEELKEAGFYAGEIDGLFGEQTAAAIRAAQESAGLEVDGVYGALTHGAVVSMIAGEEAKAPESHESPHMRLVQLDLQLLGYYEGEVDAAYGPATVAALKAFQADTGLPESGQIDAETDAALTAAMEEFAD